jgi:hypothetical protein
MCLSVACVVSREKRFLNIFFLDFLCLRTEICNNEEIDNDFGTSAPCHGLRSVLCAW